MTSPVETFKKYYLILAGLFFIAFGTFAMDFGIYRGKPGWVLWACYIGMIIIGLGMLLKKPALVAMQLYILTIPLLVWMVDFAYRLTSGQPLWGITNYFFNEMLLTARIVSFEHFFLLPLGFGGLYLLKLKRGRIWQYSILYLIMLWPATRIFTDPSDNVNCVFSSCFPYVADGPWYPVSWFVINSSMILLTAAIVHFISLWRANRS